MDYINIVSKEVITAAPDWCFWLTLGICVFIILISIPITIKQKFSSIAPLAICGLISVAVELVLIICFTSFCLVPTGRYTYGATLDKENMSVSDYEEFLETYKPELINGIYYWTGEEIEK